MQQNCKHLAPISSTMPVSSWNTFNNESTTGLISMKLVLSVTAILWNITITVKIQSTKTHTTWKSVWASVSNWAWPEQKLSDKMLQRERTPALLCSDNYYIILTVLMIIVGFLSCHLTTWTLINCFWTVYVGSLHKPIKHHI